MDDFLDFRYQQDGELHTYHCSVDWAKFPPLCPILFGDRHYSQDPTRWPFFRFAINNNDGEALAVWRAFAWAVTAGKSRHAIPCYYRDQAAEELKVEPDDIVLINWEYDVVPEHGSLGEVDRGFVPGRSSIPTRPRATSFQIAHRTKAGLFELHSPSDLTTLARAVTEASSEITIFGLTGPDRVPMLVERLRAPERPRLSEILSDGDVFVDITVDHDWYGRSHMLIRALQPLSEVESLTDHYREAFGRYRETVESIDNFDQFVTAIERLLAPPT